MIDCLIIGFNDSDFEEYVGMVRSMGTDSGAYRDLRLAFIEHENKPYHSMGILNRFCSQENGGQHGPFHNSEFLWPVITYLGTYLHRRGLSFDFVNLFQLEKDELREKLQGDVLTIAITTTLYVSPHPILEIISFIKQYNTAAKIILGGPYVSNQAKMLDEPRIQASFKSLGADYYVISSEGEAALVNVIQAIKSGSSPDAIDNIAYLSGDSYVLTKESIESNSLEDNMVDYSLFPRERFGEFVTLRTAKSCPFSCAFCGFPQRAGKYTYLSVDLVEQELNAIKELETVTTLTFIDDTFNVPKARFKDLLRMMIRNKYGFKWNSYLRSDHVDEEAIELMGESGCEGVFLGAESGSDQMLLKMNKTSRRKDYLRVIPLLRQAGITSHASLIIGFPGETDETVRETIDFIEEGKPDFFRAQLWYCDPTTPVWEHRDEYGVKGAAFNWQHQTMDVKTACNYVDKLFLTMENSVWLPQNGFELWSIFYLQRNGFKLEQIKRFLKCFNATVKAKLIQPMQSGITSAVWESLRENCRLYDSGLLDTRPIEILSGARYKAAEEFWREELLGWESSPTLEAVRDVLEETGGGEECLVRMVERSILNEDHWGTEIGPSPILLAAYSTLLSQWSGREETLIIVALGENEEASVIPLRLYPRWDLSFNEFVIASQQKLEEGLKHRQCAFHVLAGLPMMAEYDRSRAAFAALCICNESNSERVNNDLDRMYSDHSPIGNGTKLALRVTLRDQDIRMSWSYASGWFQRETVEKLASLLISHLKEVARHPGVLLGNTGAESDVEQSDKLIETDAGEVFSF